MSLLCNYFITSEAEYIYILIRKLVENCSIPLLLHHEFGRILAFDCILSKTKIFFIIFALCHFVVLCMYTSFVQNV